MTTSIKKHEYNEIYVLFSYRMRWFKHTENIVSRFSFYRSFSINNYKLNDFNLIEQTEWYFIGPCCNRDDYIRNAGDLASLPVHKFLHLTKYPIPRQITTRTTRFIDRQHFSHTY